MHPSETRRPPEEAGLLGSRHRSHTLCPGAVCRVLKGRLSEDQRNCLGRGLTQTFMWEQVWGLSWGSLGSHGDSSRPGARGAWERGAVVLQGSRHAWGPWDRKADSRREEATVPGGSQGAAAFPERGKSWGEAASMSQHQGSLREGVFCLSGQREGQYEDLVSRGLLDPSLPCHPSSQIK